MGIEAAVLDLILTLAKLIQLFRTEGSSQDEMLAAAQQATLKAHDLAEQIKFNATTGDP